MKFKNFWKMGLTTASEIGLVSLAVSPTGSLGGRLLVPFRGLRCLQLIEDGENAALLIQLVKRCSIALT